MNAPLLLAIDVGNTNTVFGLFDGDTPRAQWRAATHADRTSDEYAVWLHQLMILDGFDPKDVNAAILCSVVPESVFNLRRLCSHYLGCEALIVGESIDPGVRIAVDQPREVGADRIVNAVAAHNRYPGALIVIDFGTATTFDVVGEDGAYHGGVIAPGVNLSLDALHRAAAQLPRVALSRPQAVIGTDTIAAMQSGTYWGYVGMIEGLVERIREEHGGAMTVVATGGLAPLFQSATLVIEHVDPDLTMHGLYEIYRHAEGVGR